MGREIDVYAVGHHSRRGYFLIREKGKPDYRVAKPADVTLLEAVKIIAAANEADSVHIVLNNNPTKKPKIEVFAHLPLDETCKIEYSISNSVQAESPAKSPADIAASIPESEASTGSEKKLPRDANAVQAESTAKSSADIAASPADIVASPAEIAASTPESEAGTGSEKKAPREAA